MFSYSTLPILISCRSIASIPLEELRDMDFKKLMYKLCSHSFGGYVKELSEKDFIRTINLHENGKLCIILDGWDEVLDANVADVFLDRINRYIKDYPQIDTLVTIRASYLPPKIYSNYTGRYGIKNLSTQDVRNFCKKWFEVILSPNQNRCEKYSSLSNQIIHSREPQILSMMRNPLELSLLLTVSKNDGHLPENKAELFRELVDLYIFWNTNKGKGELSPKTVRVLLAYIATHFTKNKILYCDEKELLQIIKNALKDLAWAISENKNQLKPYNVALELSHTGVLTKTYDGKKFSFSESGRVGNHRQTQEYLTAYAIVSQYSDDEYNNMAPIEILKDKYDDKVWREVISFIVLMNNGRLRQEIINSFVEQIKEVDDAYYLSNLLFQFIIDDADIRNDDKHKIYDQVFAEHITDEQIKNIINLVNSNNRSSSDFIEYISTMFSNSVKNGKSNYGYAYAIIESNKAAQKDQSPFDYAEKLIQSKSDVNFVAGTEILVIMSWCKYAKVHNEYYVFYSDYRMPQSFIETLKKQINKKRCREPLVKCIREAVIAGFVSPQTIFDESVYANACKEISNLNDRSYCEIILSIIPVFSISFSNKQIVAETVKDYYRQKLNKEIEENKYKDIIFTFNTCAAINCFSNEELYEKWDEITDIYEKIDCNERIEKARYLQLKTSFILFRLNISFIEEFSINRSKFTIWEKEEQGDSYVVYGLKTLNYSNGTNNNLAYLLRRKEIERVTITNKPDLETTPEMILSSGVMELNPFSVINYALAISDIYINNFGKYEKGLSFLQSLKGCLNSKSSDWESIANWWLKLATIRNEYEGIVVLTWLYKLGFFSKYNLDYHERKDLFDRLEKFITQETDFKEFYEMMRF